jgi:hypothetical protein
MRSIYQIIALVLLCLSQQVLSGQQLLSSAKPQPAGASSARTSGGHASKSTNRGLFFGASLGAGAATGRYDYKTTIAPPATSVRFAPAAGFTLDWRLARLFALQMNLLYKAKGDRINMDRWAKDLYAAEPADLNEPVVSISANGYRKTNIHYLEASLVPAFVFADQLEFGLGAYLGYGLAGRQKSDYTLMYDFPDFPFENETYQSELPIEFVSLVPGNIEEGKLYLNRFDYGLAAHFGVRLHPVKISLDLGYGLKQWEPDSKLASIFFNDLNHTYNLTGTLLVGWYF